MEEDEEAEIDFFDEFDVDKQVEDDDTGFKDIEDLDCFDNLIQSAGTTIKLFEDSILKEEMDVLKNFPGAKTIICFEYDVTSINKSCCDVLQDEDNSYVILFIKEAVSLELTKEYDIKFDVGKVMLQEEIEDEATRIIKG